MDGAVTRPAWLRTTEGGVSVLAHRGGKGPWTENTLAAFAGARSMGADGVELDARLTADGAVVVHHDAAIAQGDKAGRLIGDLAFGDLPSWIPDLASAMAECDGLVVDVEIKLDPSTNGRRVDAGICRSLVSGVAEVLARPSKAFVSSFWPDALVAFGEANSRVPIGLLVHPAHDPLQAVATAGNLGCSGFHPHFTAVTRQLIERCHAAGLQVGTWTVNAKADVVSMIAAGVDSVISDDVSVALAAAGRAVSGPSE
jgi:glycerophosphoryl diester phosphodiesterase